MATRGRPAKLRGLRPSVAQDAAKEAARDAADAWNAEYPPGTLVRKRDRKGDPRPTLTYAMVLGLDAVVWVSGVRGCQTLNSLDVVQRKGKK